MSSRSLFGLFVVLLFVVDLEVRQLIRGLVGRHNTQPVTKVVLLQELLCEVLQVTAAMRNKKSE